MSQDSMTLEVLMIPSSSGLIFETSATDGAVLIMPDGAITEDLMCRKTIKKYLAKNAKTWYKFVSGVCEREVNNGDIRLVIGFDKVSSWGIATSACSVGEQVRLEFKNTSQEYTWHCDGRGSGRVGPSNRELQDVISVVQEGDRSSPLQNQCVFLRTLNFDLSRKSWNDAMNHPVRSNDHPTGSHYVDFRPGYRAGGLGAGGDVTLYATQSRLSVSHTSVIHHSYVY